MPLSKLVTNGKATLLLTMYGPNSQGKIKFELFLVQEVLFLNNESLSDQFQGENHGS